MSTQTTTPTNGKNAPAQSISEYLTFRLPRAELHVNDADNARKSLAGHDGKAALAAMRVGQSAEALTKQGAHTVDVRLAQLALSIEGPAGLENPPIVRPVVPADKAPVGCKYTLVMGFRRVRALDALGRDSFDARRPAGERAAKEMFLSALAENAARDNLSPYETAAATDRAVRDYKATGEEVARASGMSVSHTNNLVRLARRLPPTVMEAWRDGHKLATMDRLLKIAALENQADMEVMWADFCKGEGVLPSMPAAGSDPADPDADPTATPGKKPPTARLVMGRVKAALAFVNSVEGKQYAPPADAAFFGAFVRYMAGYREKPPEGLEIEKKTDKPKGKKGKRAKRKARE